MDAKEDAAQPEDDPEENNDGQQRQHRQLSGTLELCTATIPKLEFSKK